jgi:DNA-binding transcriptional ArsR family regulator
MANASGSPKRSTCVAAAQAARSRAPRSIQDSMALDPATLKALADPVRSFLVYSLVANAKTVKTLAKELGVPVTRLYYHMQRLQALGLVFVEKTRMVSGIREKHYRAAARELMLDRAAFASGGDLDRSRSEALLGFVFDQSRVEIARALEAGWLDAVRRWPEVDALMAVRTVLRLDEAQAERLYRRLADFWMEYEDIARNPAPSGKFYALVASLYPNAVDDDVRNGSSNGIRDKTRDGGAPSHARARGDTVKNRS